jgi:hypothetical protein
MVKRTGRWVVLAVLSAIAVSACGSTSSGGAPTATATATPTPSPTPNFEKTFADSDLGNLVLQAGDGPTGIPHTISGASTVAQFWECCPAMQTKWTTDGFVKLAGGHFQSPAAVFNMGNSWPAGPGLIFSFAAMFHDVAGAKQGLIDWHGYSGGGGTLMPITGVQELGPDAFAVQGDGGQLPKGSVHTYIYFWRVGNVAFSVQLSGRTGTLTETEARRFADIVNTRALG